MIEFVPFQKIPRMSRMCMITEKIDGTNAGIYIGADGEFLVASRSRWITPEEDNQGFARWAYDHREELLGLGQGMHWGEWWGSGIQRRYDQIEKRFSLFNASRWNATPPPACCLVVPVIYSGVFTSTAADEALNLLCTKGSIAAPGFMRPEGIIVYHSASRAYFKKTLEKDAEPKGKP